MTATHMQTPVGLMPIRESEIRANAALTDRELADKAIGGRFIDPEAFAELCERRLCFRGWSKADTYNEIARREQCHIER